MANYSPDTSGLISLADRPNNERTTIQSQGGISSGKKRREIKRISDIVQGIRKENEIDPIVVFIRTLFTKLIDSEIKVRDALQLLKFIKEIEPEFRPEPKGSSIAEMIALNKCVKALGNPNLSQEERDKIIAEYENEYTI